MQSIPRTVVLDRKTGSNLIQWPVKEVEQLRLRGDEFKNVNAKAGSVVPLDIGTATQVCLVTCFMIKIFLTSVPLPFISSNMNEMMWNE